MLQCVGFINNFKLLTFFGILSILWAWDHQVHPRLLLLTHSLQLRLFLLDEHQYFLLLLSWKWILHNLWNFYHIYWKWVICPTDSSLQYENISLSSIITRTSLILSDQPGTVCGCSCMILHVLVFQRCVNLKFSMAVTNLLTHVRKCWVWGMKLDI